MDIHPSKGSYLERIKRIVPPILWNAVGSARYAIQRAALLPAATFHPLRRASIRKLGEFKDVHAGQRCFIIGNGPSLKQTNLSHLRNEYSFGMNRIYLMFPELGFNTTYYLSINSLVIEQCAKDEKLQLAAALLVVSRSECCLLHSIMRGVLFS